jgi:lipopolysaccharide/colanic/teichoic acid biosynthesis glycosyltransferase
MGELLITILNSVYLVISIFGILVTIFFLLHIYWRKFVVRIDDIHIRPSSKRKPSKWHLAEKRAFDLIFSFAYIPYLPLIFLFSLLIKIMYRHQSILVKRPRIGVKGKPFNEFNFRTIDEHSGQRGKFGYFLINTSLSHLPLILNVIKGELSLVGRSRGVEILLEQRKKLQEPYDRLLLIKPGIISLWAVSIDRMQKPTDTQLEKLEYDLLYYATMSPLLDLVLMFRCVIVVLGYNSGKYLTKA